jgi:predicted TIM-barrel fold metal-dependent hydrolase
LGTGLPGGGGIKLRYTRPIPDFDDLAADFPGLKIIAMHVGDPWVEELNAVTMHKGNVYRETSGMWPRYFPEAMKYEMNRRLQDKYMFGSEYNLFPLDQLVKQHEENEYRPGFLEKLFYKNAIRILGENLERIGVNLKEWM